MQLDGVFDCCSMFLGPAFWILSSILWQLWQSTNLQFTLCSAPSSSGCCHQSVHNAVHQTPFFQISSIGSYFLCYFATKRHLMNFTLMRAPRASMKALPTSTTWIEIVSWCCLIFWYADLLKAADELINQIHAKNVSQPKVGFACCFTFNSLVSPMHIHY